MRQNSVVEAMWLALWEKHLEFNLLFLKIRIHFWSQYCFLGSDEQQNHMWVKAMSHIKPRKDTVSQIFGFQTFRVIY